MIRDEPALEELTSFLHLLTVMGTVDLRGLGIRQVKGFDDIDQIGALRIVENPSLSDWRGGDVSRVRGDVTIATNEVLNELPLLDGVTTIDGALALTDLPSWCPPAASSRSARSAGASRCRAIPCWRSSGSRRWPGLAETWSSTGPGPRGP